MSDKKIKGTPEEINRKTAEKITSSHYGVEQTAATFKLENDIFSALQVAQKRGEILTSFRQEVADLQRQLDEARATIEREQRPWRVVLCYDDGDHPFCREPLEVVDVGVSDRVYVVESQMLANIQQELDDAREDKARLENEYLTLTANTIESHEKQLAQLQQDNGRLREALEEIAGGCEGKDECVLYNYFLRSEDNENVECKDAECYCFQAKSALSSQSDISANTLAMVDKSAHNFKQGNVSEPVEVKEQDGKQGGSE